MFVEKNKNSVMPSKTPEQNILVRRVIKEAYRNALSMTRKHAKTFYFCSLFLEKERRFAAYAIYAFLRSLDDSFDLSLDNDSEKVKVWASRIDLVYGSVGLKDPTLLALKNTVKKYDIPEKYFRELLKGMEMDLTGTRYENFEQLYTYCHRVAGVIGPIMLKIFGYSDRAALLHAEKMGIAMQLTNILRDISEDMTRGRIYLPAEELAEYGIISETLRCGPIDDNFKKFMAFQIERARSFYGEASAGIKLIIDPNSRLIAALMGTLYSAILDEIENNGYDVFSHRAFVPFQKKVLLTIKNIGSQK